jgi:hypothetical protein
VTTSSIIDELKHAQQTRQLASIQFHDGEFIEYAEVIDGPTPGAVPAKIRVMPYRRISGDRFSPRGRRRRVTINTIASVTIHRDLPVPGDPVG